MREKHKSEMDTQVQSGVGSLFFFFFFFLICGQTYVVLAAVGYMERFLSRFSFPLNLFFLLLRLGIYKPCTNAIYFFHFSTNDNFPFYSYMYTF